MTSDEVSSKLRELILRDEVLPNERLVVWAMYNRALLSFTPFFS